MARKKQKKRKTNKRERQQASKRDDLQLKSVSSKEKAKLLENVPGLPGIQYDPDTETFEKAPEVASSAFIIVGSVDVHLADGHKPLYPFVELVQSADNYVLPERLTIMFRQLNTGAVSVSICDPDKPDSPVFFGFDVTQETAVMFNELYQHWGYWFFRISVGEPTEKEKRRKIARQQRMGLRPDVGQVYRDYQIANEKVFTLNTPIHTTVTHLVNGASQRTSDDWELSIAASVVSPDDGREYTQDEALVISAQQRAILDDLIGPMPWRLPDLKNEKTRKSNHRIVVDAFLGVCEQLRRMATVDEDDEGNSVSVEDRQWYRLVWSYLRSARVYEFQATTYARLHHIADVYTTEVVVGQKWEPAHIPTDEDQTSYVDKIIEAGAAVPYPRELPFDVCYFAWGGGLDLAVVPTLLAIAEVHVRHPSSSKLVGGYLLGHLVIAQSFVLGFYALEFADGSNATNVTVHRSLDEGWVDPFSLMPWTILTTIREIEDHATVIDKSSVTQQTRAAFDKFNKKHKLKKRPLLPPPFYTVHLRDRLIRSRMQRAVQHGPGRQHDYRHDVEGHDRLYYKRGYLPLSDEDRASFTKRGYRIFLAGDVIPADLYDLMTRRGRQPPRKEHWVALRKTRVEAFISPKNPDLPYIPSVRKTTKGVTADGGKEQRSDWEVADHESSRQGT